MDIAIKHKRYSIGGSTAPAICEVSPWVSRLEAYYKIVDGEAKIGTRPENPSLYWGKALEPLIRKRYEEETGLNVIYEGNTDKLGIEIVHPEYDFITGSLDGIPITKENDRILEIKTARDRRSWHDGVPEHYMVQIQHYMGCMPHVKSCDVAVLFGASDFEIINVERDDDLISVITKIEVNFWNEHIIPKIPPPPSTSSDRSIVWPKSFSSSVEADQNAIELVSKIKELKEKVDAYNKSIEGMEAILKDSIKDNEAITFNGVPIATWKMTKPSITFNKDLFSKDNPELYKQYTTEKPGYRRFLIK